MSCLSILKAVEVCQKVLLSLILHAARSFNTAEYDNTIDCHSKTQIKWHQLSLMLALNDIVNCGWSQIVGFWCYFLFKLCHHINFNQTVIITFENILDTNSDVDSRLKFFLYEHLDYGPSFKNFIYRPHIKSVHLFNEQFSSNIYVNFKSNN